MVDEAKAILTVEEIVTKLEGEMLCTCDLGNCQPSKITGHTQVCGIHKYIMGNHKQLFITNYLNKISKDCIGNVAIVKVTKSTTNGVITYNERPLFK